MTAPNWLDCVPCDRCGTDTLEPIPCDHAELCAECRADPGCRWCRLDARTGV